MLRATGPGQIQCRCSATKSMTTSAPAPTGEFADRRPAVSFDSTAWWAPTLRASSRASGEVDGDHLCRRGRPRDLHCDVAETADADQHAGGVGVSFSQDRRIA